MRGPASRWACAVALAFAGGVGPGCRSRSIDATAAAGSAPSARPMLSPAPVDQLTEGELLEGSAQAFGVPLPREVHVDGSFHDAVLASGPLGVRPLVEFFRAHLVGGELRAGDRAATFERTHAVGKPDRDLRVHIVALPRETRIEVRDVTPPTPANLPDEASRWRAVGLTPDGHLTDPAHMQ